MALHELAGKPAPRELLVHVPRLVTAFYTHRPDPNEPSHRVSFGTSGHRGSSLDHSFNEHHILAIVQAIADGHGGRLMLANRSPRGFSAKLILPA